jgi:hypothetical protein
MAMTKRKIRLEDGRYLIYFEFESGRCGARGASVQKAARSSGKRRAGGK